MSIALRNVIGSAIGGLISAVLVDVHAWSKSNERFDLRLASGRWLAGLTSGILAGFGFGQ